jgi:hypothetical protein
MKKLGLLGIIGGAGLLAAVPFSVQWSQKNVALSLDSAEARIGRPLHRRAYRRAVYGSPVAGMAGFRPGYRPEYISPPPRTGYYIRPYSYVSSYGFR